LEELLYSFEFTIERLKCKVFSNVGEPSFEQANGVKEYINSLLEIRRNMKAPYPSATATPHKYRFAHEFS